MKYSYNLLNPLDYLRLLYFVFFNVYDFPKPIKISKQIILIIQGIVTVIVINTVTGWLTGWGGNWKLFGIGVVFSVVFGLAAGVAGGLISGVWLGLADGVTTGVIGGMALGVAFGVAGCMAFGVAFGMIGCMGSMAFGMIGGVVGGIAFGMAFGVAGGVDVGADISVTEGIGVGLEGGIGTGGISVVGGVAGGVAFDIAFKLIDSMGSIWGWINGLWPVLIGGFVTNCMIYIVGADIFLWDRMFKLHSAKLDIWSSLMLLMLLSIGAGYLFEFMARWLPSSELNPIWIAILFFLLMSRLPLWPIEIVIGLIGYITVMRSHQDSEYISNSIHNWYFDLHTFLPLPTEALALYRLAELDWNKGIKEAIHLACHSGHILESVKALSSFSQTDPYGVQCHISSVADDYNRTRLFRYTFYKQPINIAHALSAYQILVNIGENFESRKREELYKKLPEDFREFFPYPPLKQKTFLTDEAMKTKLSQAIDKITLADRLTGESGILYGNEMIALYSGIRTALNWSEFSQIADFHAPELPSDDAPFLFPEALVATLTKMDEITRTIAAFNQASSQVTRQRELLQANEKLVSLEDQTEEIPKPAGPLISMVIAHWQRLLAAGGGELARSYSIEPVSNPYVIANPVIGDLFVGREDKLNRLEELWGGTGQKPSVVLFGHRRMGKSSILNNLGSRFGANTIIVDFNMQREGIVANTGELLYNLTMAIYDTLPPSIQKKLEHGEPDEEQFTNHNPHTAFNRFLKRLDRAREHTRFIVTVDEFELLEDLIDKGKADPKLLDHWRSLIQTYPWFVMALAGLHTLREMTHDYWHPLYSSVIAEPVSFLSTGAARKLITQPTPEFPLDYDADTIERIIAITNGQPYLIQLICHGLVTRFNRQTFEQGVERERRFSIKDMEAVINAPEFFRDGNAYFTGVWIQAEKSDPLEQTKVLRTMSQSEHGMTVEQIAGHMKLPNEKIENALETLTRHDVVIRKDGLWQLTVELMRRWVAQKQGEEL